MSSLHVSSLHVSSVHVSSFYVSFLHVSSLYVSSVQDKVEIHYAARSDALAELVKEGKRIQERLGAAQKSWEGKQRQLEACAAKVCVCGGGGVGGCGCMS